jgi:hypothetical protein
MMNTVVNKDPTSKLCFSWTKIHDQDAFLHPSMFRFLAPIVLSILLGVACAVPTAGASSVTLPQIHNGKVTLNNVEVWDYLGKRSGSATMVIENRRIKVDIDWKNGGKSTYIFDQPRKPGIKNANYVEEIQKSLVSDPSLSQAQIDMARQTHSDVCNAAITSDAIDTTKESSGSISLFYDGEFKLFKIHRIKPDSPDPVYNFVVEFNVEKNMANGDQISLSFTYEHFSKTDVYKNLLSVKNHQPLPSSTIQINAPQQVCSPVKINKVGDTFELNQSETRRPKKIPSGGNPTQDNLSGNEKGPKDTIAGGGPGKGEVTPRNSGPAVNFLVNLMTSSFGAGFPSEAMVVLLVNQAMEEIDNLNQQIVRTLTFNIASRLVMMTTGLPFPRMALANPDIDARVRSLADMTARSWVDETLTGEQKRDISHKVKALTPSQRAVFDRHFLQSFLLSLQQQILNQLLPIFDLRIPGFSAPLVLPGAGVSDVALNLPRLHISSQDNEPSLSGLDEGSNKVRASASTPDGLSANGGEHIQRRAEPTKMASGLQTSGDAYWFSEANGGDKFEGIKVCKDCLHWLAEYRHKRYDYEATRRFADNERLTLAQLRDEDASGYSVQHKQRLQAGIKDSEDRLRQDEKDTKNAWDQYARAHEKLADCSKHCEKKGKVAIPGSGVPGEAGETILPGSRVPKTADEGHVAQQLKALMIKRANELLGKSCPACSDQSASLRAAMEAYQKLVSEIESKYGSMEQFTKQYNRTKNEWYMGNTDNGDPSEQEGIVPEIGWLEARENGARKAIEVYKQAVQEQQARFSEYSKHGNAPNAEELYNFNSDKALLAEAEKELSEVQAKLRKKRTLLQQIKRNHDAMSPDKRDTLRKQYNNLSGLYLAVSDKSYKLMRAYLALEECVPNCKGSAAGRNKETEKEAGQVAIPGSGVPGKGGATLIGPPGLSGKEQPKEQMKQSSSGQGTELIDGCLFSQPKTATNYRRGVSGLPADIPWPPAAVSPESLDHDTGKSYHFLSTQSPGKIKSWYREQMPKKGWRILKDDAIQTSFGTTERLFVSGKICVAIAIAKQHGSGSDKSTVAIYTYPGPGKENLLKRVLR